MKQLSISINENIENYLAELESNDRAEEAEKRDRIDIIQQTFAENPELQIVFRRQGQQIDEQFDL